MPDIDHIELPTFNWSDMVADDGTLDHMFADYLRYEFRFGLWLPLGGAAADVACEDAVQLMHRIVAAPMQDKVGWRRPGKLSHMTQNDYAGYTMRGGVPAYMGSAIVQGWPFEGIRVQTDGDPLGDLPDRFGAGDVIRGLEAVLADRLNRLTTAVVEALAPGIIDAAQAFPRVYCFNYYHAGNHPWFLPPHTDPSIITFIPSPPDIDGIVFAEPGDDGLGHIYRVATPVVPSILVFPGEHFERLTDGAFKAPVHGVIDMPQDRMTFPVFNHLRQEDRNKLGLL